MEGKREGGEGGRCLLRSTGVAHTSGDAVHGEQQAVLQLGLQVCGGGCAVAGLRLACAPQDLHLNA